MQRTSLAGSFLKGNLEDGSTSGVGAGKSDGSASTPAFADCSLENGDARVSEDSKGTGRGIGFIRMALSCGVSAKTFQYQCQLFATLSILRTVGFHLGASVADP